MNVELEALSSHLAAFTSPGGDIQSSILDRKCIIGHFRFWQYIEAPNTLVLSRGGVLNLNYRSPTAIELFG